SQGSRASYRPASPSLADAHVPAGSAPKSAVRPDGRSLAFAKRSSTPQAKRMTSPASRSGNAFGSPGRTGRSSSGTLRELPDGRPSNSPVLRTPHTGDTSPMPGQAPEPRGVQPSPSPGVGHPPSASQAPSQAPGRPGAVPGAPAPGGAPAPRFAPAPTPRAA